MLFEPGQVSHKRKGLWHIPLAGLCFVDRRWERQEQMGCFCCPTACPGAALPAVGAASADGTLAAEKEKYLEGLCAGMFA